MVTYKEIQDYIKEKYGYVAQTCWIAHTKNLMKIQTKDAPNRINPNKRFKTCPKTK